MKQRVQLAAVDVLVHLVMHALSASDRYPAGPRRVALASPAWAVSTCEPLERGPEGGRQGDVDVDTDRAYLAHSCFRASADDLAADEQEVSMQRKFYEAGAKFGHRSGHNGRPGGHGGHGKAHRDLASPRAFSRNADRMDRRNAQAVPCLPMRGGIRL